MSSSPPHRPVDVCCAAPRDEAEGNEWIIASHRHLILQMVAVVFSSLVMVCACVCVSICQRIHKENSYVCSTNTSARKRMPAARQVVLPSIFGAGSHDQRADDVIKVKPRSLRPLATERGGASATRGRGEAVGNHHHDNNNNYSMSQIITAPEAFTSVGGCGWKPLFDTWIRLLENELQASTLHFSVVLELFLLRVASAVGAAALLQAPGSDTNGAPARGQVNGNSANLPPLSPRKLAVSSSATFMLEDPFATARIVATTSSPPGGSGQAAAAASSPSLLGPPLPLVAACAWILNAFMVQLFGVHSEEARAATWELLAAAYVNPRQLSRFRVAAFFVGTLPQRQNLSSGTGALLPLIGGSRHSSPLSSYDAVTAARLDGMHLLHPLRLTLFAEIVERLVSERSLYETQSSKLEAKLHRLQKSLLPFIENAAIRSLRAWKHYVRRVRFLKLRFRGAFVTMTSKDVCRRLIANWRRVARRTVTRGAGFGEAPSQSVQMQAVRIALMKQRNVKTRLIVSVNDQIIDMNAKVEALSGQLHSLPATVLQLLETFARACVVLSFERRALDDVTRVGDRAREDQAACLATFGAFVDKTAAAGAFEQAGDQATGGDDANTLTQACVLEALRRTGDVAPWVLRDIDRFPVVTSFVIDLLLVQLKDDTSAAAGAAGAPSPKKTQEELNQAAPPTAAESYVDREVAAAEADAAMLQAMSQKMESPMINDTAMRLRELLSEAALGSFPTMNLLFWYLCNRCAKPALLRPLPCMALPQGGGGVATQPQPQPVVLRKEARRLSKYEVSRRASVKAGTAAAVRMRRKSLAVPEDSTMDDLAARQASLTAPPVIPAAVVDFVTSEKSAWLDIMWETARQVEPLKTMDDPLVDAFFTDPNTADASCPFVGDRVLREIYALRTLQEAATLWQGPSDASPPVGGADPFLSSGSANGSLIKRRQSRQAQLLQSWGASVAPPPPPFTSSQPVPRPPPLDIESEAAVTITVSSGIADIISAAEAGTGVGNECLAAAEGETSRDDDAALRTMRLLDAEVALARRIAGQNFSTMLASEFEATVGLRLDAASRCTLSEEMPRGGHRAAMGRGEPFTAELETLLYESESFDNVVRRTLAFSTAVSEQSRLCEALFVSMRESQAEAQASVANAFLTARLKTALGAADTIGSSWRAHVPKRGVASPAELDEVITSVAAAGLILPVLLCQRLQQSLTDTDGFFASLQSAAVLGALEADEIELRTVFSLYAAADGWSRSSASATKRMSLDQWLLVAGGLADAHLTQKTSETIFKYALERQQGAGGGGGGGEGPIIPGAAVARKGRGASTIGDIDDGSAKDGSDATAAQRLTLSFDGFCVAIVMCIPFKVPNPFVALEKKIGPFVKTWLLPLVGGRVKASTIAARTTTGGTSHV